MKLSYMKERRLFILRDALMYLYTISMVVARNYFEPTVWVGLQQLHSRETDRGAANEL